MQNRISNLSIVICPNKSDPHYWGFSLMIIIMIIDLMIFRLGSAQDLCAPLGRSNNPNLQLSSNCSEYEGCVRSQRCPFPPIYGNPGGIRTMWNRLKLGSHLTPLELYFWPRWEMGLLGTICSRIRGLTASWGPDLNLGNNSLLNQNPTLSFIMLYFIAQRVL